MFNKVITLTSSLLCVLLIVCQTEKDLESQKSIVNPGDIYGIDISHHQGDIDWTEVKTWNGHNIQFVYMKATEGATHTDSKYAINLKEARENNHKVGSYHYFRTTSSVKDQFEHFKRVVDKDKQDLIPMVDLEENKGLSTREFNNRVREFLDLVEGYYGKKPILYSTQRFYNTYLKNRYLNYYWSIGRYNTKKPYLLDANKWTLWQFSEKGKVDGIPKGVDINILNSEHELKYLDL